MASCDFFAACRSNKAAWARFRVARTVWGWILLAQTPRFPKCLEPCFDGLFDYAVDRFRDRFHMNFPMFFGSTRRSIFDRPVHLFFVRSTTHDFEKSVQNIAHAQKNRRLAMSVRWTCEDALDQKNARKPIEKRSTNRPKDIRKIIRKTIQKSLAKHRKNEPNSMPKGFRERVAPQSDPEASRTRVRNVPEGPKSVPEASRGLRGASRERPGASQGRPRAFPDRPGSLPKLPESSKIAPKASLTDLFTILAPFWLVQACLWTRLERFFRLYVGVHG